MTVIRCVPQLIQGTYEGHHQGEKIVVQIDAAYDVSTIQGGQTVLFKLSKGHIGPNQLELWSSGPMSPEEVIEELKEGRFYTYGIE